MARTAQQVLEGMIGAVLVQNAALIAENEHLKEQMAELEKRRAEQPTP